MMADDAGAAGAVAAAAPAAPATPALSAAVAAPAPVPFAETLPEDIRGEAAFRDIRDLGALAKSYLAAQKMVGNPAAFVKLPTAPDDPAWPEVFAKLGRPEAPDKYQLKVGEGVTVDPALKSTFQEVAHKAGVTNAQAQALMDWWNGTMSSSQAQAIAAGKQAADAGVAALKQEWGDAFDAKVAIAKQAMDHYGTPGLAAELDKTGLGNAPELARMLAKLGAQLQEDGLIGRGSGGVGDAMSPAEATQEINTLLQDSAFKAAYMDKRNPGHADAIARMTRLYEFKAARSAA